MESTRAVYAEDDLLPISALQHLIFCERQCALIHIEGLWAENRLTVEGRQLHERADSASPESRGPLRVTRSLPLRSLRLGLTGRADVVEFHSAGDSQQVVPIEYKRGRPKHDDSDRIQLCAQALCLEEMLNVRIPLGALYYGQPRRRTEVEFDSDLRRATEVAAVRLHALIAGGITPSARREKKCDRCSLLDVCLPDALVARTSASRYVDRALQSSLDDSVDDEQRENGP